MHQRMLGITSLLLLLWLSLPVVVPGVETKGMPWHADLINVRGTKGDDYFVAYDQHNFQYRTFTGNDVIDLTAAGGQNYVDAGGDNDLVIDSPFYDTIRLGDGDDNATHTGGNDFIAGDDGNDRILIDVDQALTAPPPPYDVGGPFVTQIDGGNGLDTAGFILTEETYKIAIIDAFISWRLTDPTGNLDLNAATSPFGQPLNVILVDLECLEITDAATGQIVYTYP